MPDILIRGVPEQTVRAIEAAAKTLRLSRNDYLRRELEAAHPPVRGTLSIDDLKRSDEVFKDLLNPDVMKGAWR
jgi:hypothetical protein